jgi:hypothetical protein
MQIECIRAVFWIYCLWKAERFAMIIASAIFGAKPLPDFIPALHLCTCPFSVQFSSGLLSHQCPKMMLPSDFK